MWNRIIAQIVGGSCLLLFAALLPNKTIVTTTYALSSSSGGRSRIVVTPSSSSSRSGSSSTPSTKRTEIMDRYERRISMLVPWKYQHEQLQQQQQQDQNVFATSSLLVPPNNTLGWAIEERITKQQSEFWKHDNDDTNETRTVSTKEELEDLLEEGNTSSTTTATGEYRVTIGWGRTIKHTNFAGRKNTMQSDESNNRDGVVVLQLPFMINQDTLGSTVWPSSIASAILFQSPALQQSISRNANSDRMNVLELGCGLGLNGLAANAALFSMVNRGVVKNNDVVLLTDNDETVIKVLNELYSNNNTTNIYASKLDWRDNDDDCNTIDQLMQTINENSKNDNLFDLIIGSDIAYYYYLQRPLMDTIQKYYYYHDNTTSKSKLLLFAGQANRQSQWDLYDSMKHGCYNQISDRREPPWDGSTEMYLYKLIVSDWETITTTTVAAVRRSTEDDDDDNSYIIQQDDERDGTTMTAIETQMNSTKHGDECNTDSTTTTSSDNNGGILSISVIVHHNNKNINLISAGNNNVHNNTFIMCSPELDYIATKDDRDSLYID